MTKTRNAMLHSETNETYKAKGIKKGKKTKADNTKQPEFPEVNYLSWLLTNIHKIAYKDILTDVKSGIVQNVPKSQMLDVKVYFKCKSRSRRTKA